MEAEQLFLSRGQCGNFLARPSESSPGGSWCPSGHGQALVEGLMGSGHPQLGAWGNSHLDPPGGPVGSFLDTRPWCRGPMRWEGCESWTWCWAASGREGTIWRGFWGGLIESGAPHDPFPPMRGLGTGRASGAVTVLPEPGGAAPVPAGLPGPHVGVVSPGPASMCLSAHVHVCVRVFVCVHMCAYVRVCTHVHVCMFMCVRVSGVFVCVVLCSCVRVFMCVHVFRYACLFVCVCV